MEIYVNIEMRNRPWSSGEFANVPLVLKTLAIVDALGEQSQRNQFWLQELSRDMASFFFNTMPTVLMKKHPRLPQLLQWELAVQPNPNQAQKTKVHRMYLAMERTLLQANSLYQILHMKGVDLQTSCA